MKLLSLRLPDELHAALKAHAEKEKRSIHAQILYILEDYFRQLQQKRKSQE